MVAPLEYAQELPDVTTLRTMLQRQIETFRARDELIARFRLALEGKNPIVVPKALTYKAVAQHDYALLRAFNEKVARYRRVPEMKAIANGKYKKDRVAAEYVEKGVNGLLETLERQSDDSVWLAVVKDVVVLDAGVERIERAPAAFWPELVVQEDGKDNLCRLYEDPDLYKEKREEYKKAAGPPLRSVWVPLERFYPVFEASTLVETYEVEERSLRSVLSNRLFDTSQLSGYSLGSDKGFSQKVVILHYSNQVYHAYYALGPSHLTRDMWPTMVQTSSLSLGQPVLLHAYKHNLGRPIYNYVAGRGGGWKGAMNREENVMKALLDLNQDADDSRSQIATYIRNVLWPTRAMKYSREARGQDESLPQPPVIQEGGVIAMWADETLENVAQNIPDFRLAQWHYDSIQESIDGLAGSASLFGSREPGVNTGYHQQLQISQAEHLDAQLEASLARGAVNRVLLMLEHIKQISIESDEKVYVHYRSKDAKGRVTGEYLHIDGSKLDPMPVINAKVRDPRPNDILTGMQTVIQATTIRPGHDSPLYDDETALETFMGVENPSEIENRKIVQTFRNKLLNAPQIMLKITQDLGLELADRQNATISPQDAQDASPAFKQAVAGMNTSGESAGQGGISPGNAINMTEGGAQLPDDGAAGMLNGVGGGLAPGNPQPMQTMGRGQALLNGAQ